ncbi:sensitivity to red light reduced-srr1 [Phlyctema vagabunda]|uniref:Sensitivity to red light reduced-srr1 n=1 Tax=Phlyctema vagabunda TaxID=108571 RepID=A0ABR4PHB1_9HELO
MPHTNRKKKTSGAQPAKPQVIHTKRQEVEDSDGWTHVIEGRRHTSRAEAKSKSKEPWLHGGDFTLQGLSYINRTLEQMTADQEHYHKQWESSDAFVSLKGQLEPTKGRFHIANVVCLGLGSLQSSRREGRRASHTQLAALRTIIQQCDIKSGTCYFQDPQFTPLDKEYLESQGYKVVDDPMAFDHITETTIVYAIHCYAEVYERVSKSSRPALLVSTDVKNFDGHAPSNATVAALETLVEGCEELDFPQLRHDFSDTKLYWRSDKEPDAAAKVSPVDASTEILELSADAVTSEPVLPETSHTDVVVAPAEEPSHP